MISCLEKIQNTKRYLELFMTNRFVKKKGATGDRRFLYSFLFCSSTNHYGLNVFNLSREDDSNAWSHNRIGYEITKM